MARVKKNEQLKKDLEKVECLAQVSRYESASSSTLDFERQITESVVDHINATTELDCSVSPLLDAGGRGSTAGALGMIRLIAGIVRLVSKIPFLGIIQHRSRSEFLRTRPTITISLKVASDHQFDSTDLFDPISRKLSAILFVVASEVARLRAEYPTFRFGYIASVVLAGDHTCLNYSIQPDQIAKYFDDRILYASTGFKFEKNLDLSVGVTRLRLLKFVVSHTERVTKLTTYYSLFSRTIIGGFAFKSQKSST